MLWSLRLPRGTLGLPRKRLIVGLLRLRERRGRLLEGLLRQGLLLRLRRRLRRRLLHLLRLLLRNLLLLP